MLTWFLETCVLSDKRVTAFREACARHDVAFAATLDVDQPPEPRRRRPDEGAAVVAYGSKSVLRYAQQRHWQPGVWTGDAFDYANVHQALGEHFLNADAVTVPLDAIEAAASQNGWQQFFIRPVDDNKSFAGTVLNAADVAAWRAKLADIGYLADPSAQIVMARPKPLKQEWRLVVVGENVATSSRYRDKSGPALQTGAPDEVAALARTAAQRYRPAPVFVMDIGEVDGGGLAVIELNCFNSADLYACNIDDVVARVSDVAR